MSFSERFKKLIDNTASASLKHPLDSLKILKLAIDAFVWAALKPR